MKGQSILFMVIISLSMLQCDGCGGGSGGRNGGTPTWKGCCWGSKSVYTGPQCHPRLRKYRNLCPRYKNYRCDECQYCNNGGCEHTCTNTDKSFNCNCRQGFLKDGKKCIAVCPVLKVPKLAKRKCFSSHPVPVVHSVCVFECLHGYKAIRGTRHRTCKADGHWSGDELRCEKITCPLPYITPKHATRRCPSADPVYPKTSCYFKCLPGYKRIGGSIIRTCKADGHWSGDNLQCKVVTCPALPQLSEGLSISSSKCIQSKSEYQDECLYTCGEGYKLYGNMKKVCTASGQWSAGENAHCKDIVKPYFGSSCPLNIKAFVDKHRSSVKVKWTIPSAKDNALEKPVITQHGRKPGEFFLPGHHTITYIAADKARNTALCVFQVIVEVVCPVLKVPKHAKRRCFYASIPVANSFCTFECLHGYKAMRGSSYRICNVNGDWSGDVLQCQKLICPSLLASVGGYMKCSLDNEYGSHCRFGCKTGYTRIGSAVRTCKKNDYQWFGEWTGSTTFCQENEQ